MKISTIIILCMKIVVSKSMANTSGNEGKIVVCINSSVQNGNKNLNLYWRPTSYYDGQFIVANAPSVISKNAQPGYNTLKWVLKGNSPLIIQADNLPVNGLSYLLEAGDSIVVEAGGKEPIFSGKGAEKLNLVTKLISIGKNIKFPANNKYYITTSLEDFQEWNAYLDAYSSEISKEIYNSKKLLSPLAFDYMMYELAVQVEYNRLLKAKSILDPASPYIKGLSANDRIKIFDTTLNRPLAKWLRSYAEGGDQAYYLYYFLTEKIKRDLNYDRGRIDSLHKNTYLNRLYLNEGSKLYKGNAFKAFETIILTSLGIKDDFGNPEIEKMLQEFYAREKNPVLRKYVQNYEHKTRLRHSRDGSTLQDFLFTDINEKPIGKDAISHKIVLIRFKSIQNNDSSYASLIKNIKKEFQTNPNFMFLDVSAGGSQEQWKESVNNEITNPGTIQLYTSGTETDKNTQAFTIEKYPSLYLIGMNGKILYTSYNEGVDLEKEFRENIRRELLNFQDGPYVMHEKNGINAYYLVNGNKQIYKADLKVPLIVQGEDYDSGFSFYLKNNLSSEPSIYAAPEKIFVVSDIEGNFTAFKELLQANKVIDKKMNWTFGKGHLVLCGDFFDRGSQVTECLWLIYSLEEKARKEGGYVHFIIGNHEVMNLTGDIRYVHKKYLYNSSLFDSSYADLYAEKSELGRWLCTKNVIEKIGDIIFVHGGISLDIVNLEMTVDQINEISKKHYRDRTAAYSKDKSLKTLFGETSPLWFRGYYSHQKIDEVHIDKILQKFDAKKIITGHTILGTSISKHYSGKVINVDVPHAKGISEALLIEKTELFRVDKKGKRMPL